MQSIQRDLQQLSMDSGKGQTFLDVVGADVDGTFKDSLTYQQTSAISEISIGGQSNVAPGSTIQLAFRNEGVLQSLDKTLICGEVTFTGLVANNVSDSIPINALYLFRPVSCQLGSTIVWNTTQGEHYIQAKLLEMKPDQVIGHSRGLLIPLSPNDDQPSAITTADELATGERALLKRKSVQQLFMAQSFAAASRTFQFAIPLKYLFPQLYASLQDGFVYIAQGQHLVMNLQLVEASQILGVPGRASPIGSYSLAKCQMISCYSKLDGNLLNQVMKAQIPIHKINATGYIQQFAQNVVFSVNMNKQERLRKLYFCISGQIANPQADVDYNTDATIFKLSGAGVTGAFPLAYQSMYLGLLMRCCTLIQINFGGHTFTINQQSLHSLFEANLCNDSYLWGHDHPSMAKFFKVFTLDCSRFGLDKFFGDAYGSSSGNSMVCQITLNFAVGEQISLVDGLSTANTFQNKIIRLYTETMTEASCESGIYRAIN